MFGERGTESSKRVQYSTIVHSDEGREGGHGGGDPAVADLHCGGS